LLGEMPSILTTIYSRFHRPLSVGEVVRQVLDKLDNFHVLPNITESHILIDECIDERFRNSLKDLLPLVPVCLAHIESIQPGQIVRIEG
jgi:hypothetical protein